MCLDKRTESFILYSITVQNDSFTLKVPLFFPDLLNQNFHFNKIPSRFICILNSYAYRRSCSPGIIQYLAMLVKKDYYDLGVIMQ